MAEILEFPTVESTSQSTLQPALEVLSQQPLGDHAARELALDTRHSFIVEAPAGSGKTGLLMQRFLNLLASPSTAAPEEILAITFTRKATAELRERILQQLDAAAAPHLAPSPGTAFEQKTRALALAALQRDRQLGWNLLTDPRRLRIQTIDALCLEIAATLPLLSGSAARSPVDDAAELYREAARNTLRQLGRSQTPAARQLHDALHTVLLHRDGNLADVEALLADMLSTREQWAELVPLDRASVSDEVLDREVRLRLERTLERVVCSGLTRALHAIPAHALADLAALAHRYAGEPGYRDDPNPFQLCGSHPGPPGAEAAHLDHWHALIGLLFTGSRCEWRKRFNHNHIKVKLSAEDQEHLQSIVAEIRCEPLREALEAVRCLPPAKYPDDQWRQAKALFRLLLHALAELKLLFAETGQSDFTEFSLAARQALAHHADDFQTGAGTRLRHLLVDEMQDTSSAQYDLLTALTRTWDGRSQTLFLVGDPKQSIYLFRQARVERFLRTTRDRSLGDVPLQPLQLTANFRSRPAVVAGVNRDFAHLFTSPSQPLSPESVDVPFVAAAAARTARSGTGVHWHTRVLTSEAPQSHRQDEESGSQQRSEAEESRSLQPVALTPRQAEAPAPGLSLAASAAPGQQQQDAAKIRRVVEHWRARPLPADRTGKPWRIAILAYARRHLAPIVAEFNRFDRTPIPYRAVKVEALQDRPEVRDALALTRALRHPADRTAWFAVLRAPWCGLDAADLLALSAEGNPTQAKSTVPELIGGGASSLSSDGKRHLQRVWPELQAALEGSTRDSQAENAERCWRSLGCPAFLTPDEHANVERFFALLSDSQNGGTIDFHNLKQRLKDLYAEPSDAPGAVELTTIHNAKGLEWDVVIVPELGRRGQPERPRLLNWLELESGGEPSVLLAPIHGKGDSPSSLFQWLNKAHASRLQAERKRVFYVACTRAREELHLFATAAQVKNRLGTGPGSLLHACWPAAAPHFAQDVVREEAAPFPDGLEEEASRTAPLEASNSFSEPGLTLAAAASPDGPARETPQPANPYLPRLTRFPLSFDPRQRFRDAAARRLPYIPAAELPHQVPLTRPEGSAAARALGNVVHRFLEQLAVQLSARITAHTAAELLTRNPPDPVAGLQAELPTWLDRLTASFRAEGLAPAEAGREASRALTLLANTLADPTGIWLLSPHNAAASERPLATAAGLLRVDRTFIAGPSPLVAPEGTVWVVDFKTTHPGGRARTQFLAEQRAAYGPQLARYAQALRDARAEPPRVQLGLYFPAIPHLLHWSAEEAESPLYTQSSLWP